jgi:hypothetical protein
MPTYTCSHIPYWRSLFTERVAMTLHRVAWQDEEVFDRS